MPKFAALAILVAAALVPARAGATEPPRTPKPTATPALTPDQKQAADAWVKDAYAWADQLTKLGEGLGMMFTAVIDGKQRTDALKAQLKETTTQLDEKAGVFGARPAPAFAEMTAFKTAFVDYLAWQRKVIVAWTTDVVRIADDKKLKPAEKQQALSDSLRAQEKDENVWKDKIQTRMKAVYAALNRK